jgi:hypothetical protein
MEDGSLSARGIGVSPVDLWENQLACIVRCTILPQLYGGGPSMSTEILHGMPVGRTPAHIFRRGSRASRSPSPSRFMARTVIRIAKPGVVAIHQCSRK